MKHRLIELLLSVPPPEVIVGKREGKRYATAWHIADHLIANGVIVPPAKVGDTIYMLVTKKTHSFDLKGGERRENQHTFIKKTILMESNFFRVIRDIGKTVFLTREDAEKALKGGE